MTITLNEYTIELKAKNTWLDHTKYNKKDTEAFLTHLACALIEAEENATKNGYEGSAKWYKREWQTIADMLTD